jgi:hypothetical protein
MKMSRILLILNHIALCTPCITLLLGSHTCTFAIDPAELELEEPMEYVQAEDFTNLD